MKKVNKASKPSAYDPAKIESKWQKKWASSNIFQSKEDAKKDKFYVLDMFPYPSGEGLHVGHPKGYIATDVISRMHRMQGKSVLHPMGFDAFGLPAENYAIKTKTNPEVAVRKNVDRYKKQLEMLGLDYDWSREVNTTDPNYYRWTQWIFLQLYKKGLAFESNEPVNWCPTDKTVLANEDVENGRCERCGTPVEKKPLRQWVLRITDYAERLLADLDATDYVMPVLIDRTNPHRSGKPLVKRNVAHAIVYDPKTNKYLIIRNKKFNWDTVIIGGIEEGEDAIETARREVREETGYTDLEFKRILGGPTEAHYYTKHKDQNRIAYATGVYFELKSDARVAIGADEDKDNEILWVDEGDFVPGKLVNSELPIWLGRMGARLEYDPQRPGIPCFVDTTPTSAYREGVEVVERNAIAAIVKHWKEDKYMGIKWKKVAWRSLITGGPDGNETLEEGAVKEIVEETGYLHPKLVRKLGVADAKFYHPPKGINRFAHFNAMYFELKDGARADLTQEENDRHEVVWLTKEEMSDFLTVTSQRYMWDTLFLGKPNDLAEPKPLLDWPNSIKELQKNWIGKSEGALISFKLSQGLPLRVSHEIEVFTTRPDTLFGVTYIVLAPEHKLVGQLLSSVSNKAEVEAYISKAQQESEIERTDATKEKTGVELKGIKAINPVNNEEVAVWIADYVLADYGTGAVMAVPAHDERDWDFAKKFKLPIRQVVAGEFGTKRSNEERRDGGCAVIFDPKTQKYAVFQMKNGRQGFFGGGVAEGEDIQKGILREVAEESGLYDFEHVEIIDRAFAHFYNVLKKKNRIASATCLLIILKSTDVKKTAMEDHEDFSIAWTKPEEYAANLRERNTEGDHDHWLRFLDIGVSRAIELGYDKTSDPKKYKSAPYVGTGKLVDSGKFNGLDSESAKKKIVEFAGGKWVTKYKLRDWVFSRQRYWGEPIPLIHCPDCGVAPVPEKQLPVKLPKVKSYEPTGTGESPLANIASWVNVKCPQCKGKARRETNTMPQWAGSCWYYLRYMDPKNKKAFVSPKNEKYWAPVDLYVGGAEHATRHLIYARFWHKVLFDLGYVSTIEPFMKLQHVGLIMGDDGRKMSKRFGNVINPDEMVKTFGADSLRVYEMFMGPFDQQISWNTDGLVGTRRFIERVWKLRGKVGVDKDMGKGETQIINKTIKKVNEDIQGFRLNTAVSALMIAVNELEKQESISRSSYENLLKLIAPFAPHVADELWTSLGNKKSIHISSWPTFDPKLAADSEITIILQVNGKVRGSFTAAAGTAKEELLSLAKALPEAKKWLEGKEIKKEIVVPGRLVNFVI